MDLLGNRALSTIDECVTLARAARPEAAASLDPERVPDPDPETSARLAAGDTLNCFQLESPAMRHLLRMLDTRAMDPVIAAVALVRPGPAESGMKAAFCRRARGLESPAYLHERLRSVLEATHGVMLYEEDVMRVASALTGLSLAEGDDLRRAIGAARHDDARQSLERGFVAQARRAGVDEATAHAVWGELARFGSYAFCKAHAAGYGALGYVSAYLKTHAPVEWAVAVLNHHAGMYATWVHVEDLRRRGVRFEAPCVQRSAWATTLERDAANDRASTARASGSPGAGRVRVGLGRVFGLHESTGTRIVAARAESAFESLADMVDRARPTLPELESLIDAGALDTLGRTRPSLRLEARVTAGARRGPAPILGVRAGAGTRRAPVLVGAGGDAFLPSPSAPVATPELPEFRLAERVRRECDATGLWFAAHPLDALLPPDAERGAVPAATLEVRAGAGTVTIVGMTCASRRVETRNGEPMLFLTVADRSGLAECVLFPDTYRAFADAARGAIVRVEGRVDIALLSVSSANMRVKGRAADLANILPSVRARGVLVPLIVRPNGKDGHFEVVAGKRRYQAALAIAGEAGESDPLPCAIMAAGDDAAALEASLIENVARLDPDEVTRWESFTRLVREGRTAEDIALTFRLTELQVKRTLALGNLLPRIRSLYRRGEIDAATVRHLTLASKARQRDWLALLDDDSAYCPTGFSLKAWLFGGASIPVSAALFDLDSYSGEGQTEQSARDP